MYKAIYTGYFAPISNWIQGPPCNFQNHFGKSTFGKISVVTRCHLENMFIFFYNHLK